MRRFILNLLIIAGVITQITLVSCSGDEEVDTDPQSREQMENTLATGSWIITRFLDSGKDELVHFNGFTFIFDNSGMLISSNGTLTYEGTWSIVDSNSDDDSPDDMDLIINFNLTNDFADLNDEWEIVSISSNKIELIDISGGNGDTDYLTFEKN